MKIKISSETIKSILPHSHQELHRYKDQLICSGLILSSLVALRPGLTVDLKAPEKTAVAH